MLGEFAEWRHPALRHLRAFGNFDTQDTVAAELKILVDGTIELHVVGLTK
jgi:hypothetical protein